MGDLRNDIEKYLRGELSPTERNALEKRALNDPFLADALEGAESISMEDFSSDLKSLQHSLIQRTKRDETKVVPLWSWTMRIAAGLLIVAVAGFAVYQITKKDDNAQLAQTEPSVKDAPATKPTESTATDSLNASSDVQPPVMERPTVAEKPVPIAAEKPKPVRRNDLAVARELAPATGVPTQRATPEKEDRAANVSTPESQPAIINELSEERGVADKASGYMSPIGTDSTDDNSADIRMEHDTRESRVAASGVVENQGNLSKAKKELAPASAPVVIRARGTSEVAAANGKVIKGKVISADDGTGLPGVNVTIKGTDVGTITDAEGNYQIAVEHAVSGLVFSFIGMESQEVTLEDATQVNVALNQDMTQLSEVVVTGYGMDADEDTKGRITFATPSGGRTAFKKYIETSMHYPEQALVNEVEGRVTIQFTVESSGALSDIKVVRGIGYGCDEEVIRLIKEGPKWNPTRRDDEPIKGKMKVRVRFKLPKK